MVHQKNQCSILKVCKLKFVRYVLVEKEQKALFPALVLDLTKAGPRPNEGCPLCPQSPLFPFLLRRMQKYSKYIKGHVGCIVGLCQVY